MIGVLDFLNRSKERTEKSIATYNEQKAHIKKEFESMDTRLDQAILTAKEELAVIELMREKEFK